VGPVAGLAEAVLGAPPHDLLLVVHVDRQRPGEVEGRDYFFVDRPEFERRREAGEFLEWAEVHGNLYATSRTWIEGRIEAGVDIVLEIDWQGATQVQRLFPDAIGVFVVPPSIGVLRERASAGLSIDRRHALLAAPLLIVDLSSSLREPVRDVLTRRAETARFTIAIWHPQGSDPPSPPLDRFRPLLLNSPSLANH
jgi:hypothetical protein